jgi:hypothetical protein
VEGDLRLRHFVKPTASDSPNIVSVTCIPSLIRFLGRSLHSWGLRTVSRSGQTACDH